jgi:hypothetical protein
MSIYTILLVILILMLVGALPTWHSYGYAPSGVVGTILIILVVLMLLGKV